MTLTMPLCRLVFVLPCHSFDDFPEHLGDDLAEDFLGAWTALWHPKLIATLDTVPEWKRADSAALDIHDAIVVYPKAADGRIDTPLRERLEMNGCTLLMGKGNRLETLKSIEQHLKSALLGPEVEHLQSPPLLRDFYALGYAFLQIHLVTHRVRYSQNINQPLFNEQAIAAAKAYEQGDPTECNRWIQSCFDQLAQERDHYYSQKTHLIDMTLVAETTLGEGLSKQISQATLVTPQNFLASAAILRKLASARPDSMARLREVQGNGSCCIVGGLDEEGPHPWLNASSLRRDLAHGRQSYKNLGLVPPRVFSRLLPGMISEMPMHLLPFGYIGAMLLAWQGGAYPEGEQAKICWESADGSALDTIASNVLDAASPDSFLAIGTKLGSQFDHHQVPTLTLAHWPNRVCEAFLDFQAVAQRTPALGEWMRVDDYFLSTQHPYHQDRLSAAKFSCPEPQLAAHPNDSFIASVGRYYQHVIQSESLGSMEVLSEQIRSWLLDLNSKRAVRPSPLAATHSPSADPEIPTTVTGLESKLTDGSQLNSESAIQQPDESDTNSRQELEAQPGYGHQLDSHVPSESVLGVPNDLPYLLCSEVNQELFRMIDRSLVSDPIDRSPSIGEQLVIAGKNASTAFRDLLPRGKGDEESSYRSWLLINPSSGPRRCFLSNLDAQFEVAEANRIYATSSQGITSHVIVDVPPMGVLRLVGQHSSEANFSKSRSGRTVASEDFVLANEFLEVQVDADRGSLRSLHISQRRGNQLSGMLAIHDPKRVGEKEPPYSTMRVSGIQVLESTSIVGRIQADGDLVFGDQSVGQFSITYTLWRGSRILELEGTISNLKPMATQTSAAYVAWRTAWPSATAFLSTWLQGTKCRVATSTCLAPLLVEIDNVDHKIYVLPSGNAQHRVIEDRFLDTLLIRNDQSRLNGTTLESRSLGFRLGLGVDLPRPYQAACDWLDPPRIIEDSNRPLSVGAGAWFINCSSSNIHLTLIGSLVDNSNCIVGMRIYLHETQGTSNPAKLQFFRNPKSADRVDTDGNSKGKLSIEGDSVMISVRANEQSYVDLVWE